ncbi:ABC transporter permease [Litorimonas sp. RW-G-Af-16]|uniref:ABC transporter permease n=1 Tax=Litorimonas sp. RW-G-Af-16 TaxID=3241168 RepID=UPI00390C406B
MSIINSYRDGFANMASFVKDWRIIHLLGFNGLRRRYARSKIGQFWITINLGIVVLALGLLWSQLWRLPITEFVPHVAASSVIFTYISGTLMAARVNLQSHASYFINNRLSHSVSVTGMMYEQGITLLHNLIIILLCSLFFQIKPTIYILTVPFSLLVITAILYMLSYIIAYVCVRYRDMIEVIGSILQVTYFVTPIMWTSDLLPDHLEPYLFLNPVAAMIEIVTDPILGKDIDPKAFYMVGGLFIVLLIITPLVVARNRKRAIYWM